MHGFSVHKIVHTDADAVEACHEMAIKSGCQVYVGTRHHGGVLSARDCDDVSIVILIV